MAPRLEVQELIGHKLVDQDGHNVGKIRQVYRDDQTHQPTWVTVHTGMFGHQENFVPLVGAEVTEQELRVPFSRKVIKDSPRFDTGGHLSPEEEAQLYQYYGVRPTVPGPRGDMEDAVAEERAREAPEGETSMTISEERAWVGVERTESGHARVHKTVESEQFEQDGPGAPGRAPHRTGTCDR